MRANVFPFAARSPSAWLFFFFAVSALGCGKKQADTAPPTTAAPAGSAPTTAAAATAAPQAAPLAAAPASAHGSSKVAKCAAGTSLVWADNDSAKCLRACEDDKGCAKGQSCVPGNVADDDGNPIPHDVVNVCLGPSGTPGAAPKGAPAPHAAATPAPGTMELPNTGHPPCPSGFDDQGGVLDTCNKSCTAAKDCKAPFTCQSLTGDAAKVCADMKHIRSRQ